MFHLYYFQLLDKQILQSLYFYFLPCKFFFYIYILSILQKKNIITINVDIPINFNLYSILSDPIIPIILYFIFYINFISMIKNNIKFIKVKKFS